MKKTAIRAHIGDWVYYITALTFDEVNSHVKRIDKELHKSDTLSEMLQRSLTNNVDKIAQYIKNQEERFFNALVLAVYDGSPNWKEVALDYGNDEKYFNLGLLEFTNDEKIFPVDGQHRVEGIKKTLETNPEMGGETIPVIFIAHKNTTEGMQRSRRLFSTLNRYAKPVSLSDIIALDEDDSIAIATRNLIENMPLFSNKRMLNHKQKAIPDTDKIAFTNIISLYECNTALLNYFIKNKEIKDFDGKKLKGRTKIDFYCRFRKDESEINEYENLVSSFWDSFVRNFDIMQRYLNSAIADEPAREFRNENGGCLLFRPVGQKPFVNTAIALFEKFNDWDRVMQKLSTINYNISEFPWQNVAWNPVSRKMISSSNGIIIEFLLKFITNEELLHGNEIEKMIELYRQFQLYEHESKEAIKTELESYVINRNINEF